MRSPSVLPVWSLIMGGGGVRESERARAPHLHWVRYSKVTGRVNFHNKPMLLL